jgi:thiamine biosynthesis lipoprotein
LADDRDPAFLQAAAEEALAEIQRVESWLSPYRPGSSVAGLNSAPVGIPVRLDPLIFGIIHRAAVLTTKLYGAFDLLVGHVTAAQRGFPGKAVEPSQKANLLLDPVAQTATRLCESTRLDTGGIGKGWALERASSLLRDAGLTNAFLHGGTSSSLAMGAGPRGQGWNILLPKKAEPVPLRDGALSVSSSFPRFASGSHIVNPRTGNPVKRSLTVAVLHQDGIVAEAISTALVVLGPQGIGQVRRRFPSATIHAGT